MKMTFYKDFNIAIVITNVKTFTKCSTGDVQITLTDSTTIEIKKEQYNFFGATI